MKGRQKKIAVIAAVTILLVSAFSAIFILFFNGLIAPRTDLSPHYLSYVGGQSRIFMVSASSTFDASSQTYMSEDGQQIAQASHLYTINLTLRNDYSSENPPPSTGTPTAPIDGTAYITLKATLYDNGVTVPTVNLSPSDFTTQSPEETALVLASGQTSTIQLRLATNQTKISDFSITLVSISDSILR